jgi:predicted ATP-grasp superfamily ATP-dependent carboligase
MADRLIIVGASTRAAAQSAVRSGFRAWCIDQFGDQDLRACAEHVEVVDDWPQGILSVVPQIPPGTLVFNGALENAPAILARLRERFSFAGCDVDAMRALRDPHNLQQILRQAGLDALRVSLHESSLRESIDDPSLCWLKKPLKSAAGFSIGFHELASAEDSTEPGDRNQPPRSYFQEFREGESISALYLSSGEDCQLVGLTRQLIGLDEAGCGGFRYCGSVGPLTPDDLSPRVFEMARRIGRVLAEATGCRGLFGCDLIWNRGAESLHVCEVNPRYTASAEVLERAGSAPLMSLHLNACRGQLPDSVNEPTTDTQYHGKLICFAKRSFRANLLKSRPPEIRIADIPSEDTEIAAGHPICTVLAKGDSESSVRAELFKSAAEIHRLT